jgi:nicotinamide mononucleotide transporter
MSALDFLIFIISVIGIFLEMWQKPVFWLTYIIAAILLGFQFWQQQLLGSWLLQICYIIMAIFGWYKWLAGLSKDNFTPCLTLNRQWLNYFVVTVLMGYALYNIFIYYNAANPVTDAILTSISLVATYMAIYKHISSWFIFAATTLISIPLYFSHELYFTALTYMVFGSLDLCGGMKWLRDYRLLKVQTT